MFVIVLSLSLIGGLWAGDLLQISDGLVSAGLILEKILHKASPYGIMPTDPRLKTMPPEYR